MNRTEIYIQIADKIISKLEEGIIPWRKSWCSGVPTNLVSKKAYQGINYLSLLVDEYPSPLFLTYLQCKQLGGIIKTGQKGSLVVYWKLTDMAIKNDSDNCATHKVPFIRYSYVFNIAQTTLSINEIDVSKPKTCDELLYSMVNVPKIRHNYRRCYYDPIEDVISIPIITSFDSAAEYYSNLWHEIIHSTGHFSRLGRFSTDHKDSHDAYSEEELIAEFGAAFLSGLCNISNEVIDNQSAYIQGWAHRLKSNPDVLVTAALQAKKAVSYLLGEN